MKEFDYRNVDYADLEPVRNLLEELCKAMARKTDFDKRDYLIRRIEQEKFRLFGAEQLLAQQAAAKANVVPPEAEPALWDSTPHEPQPGETSPERNTSDEVEKTEQEVKQSDRCVEVAVDLRMKPVDDQPAVIAPAADMKQKRCYVCKQDKPLDEFAKHVAQKDGHQRICKACKCEYQKRYRERKAVEAKGAPQLKPNIEQIPSVERPEGAPETKQCNNCKTIKPLDKFPIANKETGERSPYCTPCYIAAKRSSLTRARV